MRRISLAMALIGAAAAAGCAGNPPPAASSGTQQGVQGKYFFINMSSPPMGGYVVSSVGGINCGASAVTVNNAVNPAVYVYTNIAGHTACARQTQIDWSQSVTLTATADTGNVFVGWAGDCTGSAATCDLTAGLDKNVVAIFAKAGQAGHPSWMDPALHGPAYLAYWAAVTATPPTTPNWDCATCHGADLLGQSIAPSCGSCHAAAPITADLGGGHFIATGHNSGACARCHTADGFRDFIGASDSSSAVLTLGYGSSGGGVCVPAGTDTPSGCSIDVSPVNPGMRCDMCHNRATVLGDFGSATNGTLNQHKFASGNIVMMNGKTAICAQCHDGGRPGYEVYQLGVATGTTAADTLLPATQKTSRAHYLPAASTLFGAEAAGYYQYSGMIYTARNEHGGKGNCSDCHNPHNGQLPPDSQFAATCGKCHFNEAGASVSSFLDLEESRQFGFEGDIDGDGVIEPLKTEIDGLGAKLYEAIQAYGTNVSGASICVVSNRAYTVTDSLVACNVAPNNVEYTTFTPRLLRAVFNYLMYQNDVGGWAHNPRYEIEVLFDTITDLNAGLVAASKTPVAFAGFRAFNGHFGAADAASPYSAMVYHATAPQGFTSAACYQCHGGNGGFTSYLSTAPAALTPTVMTNKVTALQCSTCHALNGRDMASIRSDIKTVYFPPQKPLPAANAVAVAASTLPKSFAVCATCHSGRENKTTIDLKVTGVAADSWTLSFTNPHYLGAAAVMLGSDTHMLYEYGTNWYAGKPVFWSAANNGNAPGPHGSPHGASCSGCHQPKASKHSFEADLAWCGTCHVTAAYGDFRLAPLKTNVANLASQLYTTLTAYSQAAGHAICYNGAAHPYFYLDNGASAGDGVCQADETTAATLNPAALKAAYNYKWAQAEPGAYAHNYEYIVQILMDSILDLDPAAVFPVDAKAGTAFMPAGTLITRPAEPAP